MANVALIACDHGLGHVRRCLMVASELGRRGVSVTLFAPQDAVRHFPELQVRTFDVVDFATTTTVLGLKSGEKTVRDWSSRLPSLDDYDLVVSDNLPEILEIRPDAVLSGSFLWHQVLPEIDFAIRRQAERLLARYRPVMIASRVFASSELILATRAKLVGLCAAAHRPVHSGTDMLIACGGTSLMDDAFREAVAEFSGSTGAPPFPVVWVDRKLMPPNPPTWMQAAVFSPALYGSLAACVCRPGVGTLTDALWAGARVFCVAEYDNAEMLVNAERVTALGVGQACTSPGQAIADAIEFIRNCENREWHSTAVSGLNFNGVAETADILISMCSRREQ